MIYNVCDFGAVGDGKTKNTNAIQAAIDACAKDGGGVVQIPKGVFLSGTIELKSNVELNLLSDAILYSSACKEDYKQVHPTEQYAENAPCNHTSFSLDYHLIVAQNIENIAITGSGMIFGNGLAFIESIRNDETRPGHQKYNMNCDFRPGPMICFDCCTNVKIEDVFLKESPCFHIYIIGCNQMKISNIIIRTDYKIENGDGIHIESSENILISGCDIEAGDDAIALFNFCNWLETDKPTVQNIVVSNCILASDHSGIRIGYTTDGLIQNCTFSNIIIKKAFTAIDILSHETIIWEPYLDKNRNLHLYGPTIKNMIFSNFVIDSEFGITLNLYHNTTKPAAIDNISFQNMTIRTTCGNYIFGSANNQITNIRMKDITIIPVGERSEVLNEIPEHFRPSKNGLDKITHALAVRWVNKLLLESVTIQWEYALGHWLYGIYGENVTGANINNLMVENQNKVNAFDIAFKNSQSIFYN